MRNRILFIGLSIVVSACITDSTFSVPEIECIEANITSTHSISQIRDMAGYGLVTFDSDIIIEGYVVSSDEFGNMYKSISIQDTPQNPSSAIMFSVDKTNLYTVFPVSRKIYVKLRDLSIGYNRGALQIGKAVGADLERIPNSQVFNHFIRSCEDEEIVPRLLSIHALNDSHLETLIQLNSVQFRNEDLGSLYGALNSTKTMDRMLVEINDDCELEKHINMRMSGFSDFKNKELPRGKGNVIGVLSKYYSNYQLIIRSEKDVTLEKARCSVLNSDVPPISYEEIVNMYSGGVLEFGIEEELIFEGYVISSDQDGNFINTLYIQDAIENPQGGFKLLIEGEEIFESFNLGDKVMLRLNYLYLDKIDGVYTIGVFKDSSVHEITEEEIGAYVFNTGYNFEILPKTKDLGALSTDENQNTLVTVTNIQLSDAEIGKAFAYYSGAENGNRSLEVCGVSKSLELLTLGTASFAKEQFPKDKLEITGVLFREGRQLKMQLRDISDIDFFKERERCEFIEPKILITEVADPENRMGARFVELYNAGDVSVSLNGWQLNKYVNGSTKVSGSGLDLSSIEIQSKEFSIIGNSDFESVFNIVPDIETVYVSGNGDDVYELIDKQGKVRDVYGVIGEDGTEKEWEYLDGKAIRKIEIETIFNGFNLSEWEIFTKATGNEQLAPQDFTPGIR